MGELDRHQQDSEGVDTGTYVKLALGVAFLAVFGILGVGATFLASWVFLIPAAIMLSLGMKDLQDERRKAISPSAGKEQELLSALRDKGGRLTPAQAAMQTSLTVKEADLMLSELTGEGHLLVESEGGSLVYVLPSGSLPELDER